MSDRRPYPFVIALCVVFAVGTMSDASAPSAAAPDPNLPGPPAASVVTPTFTRLPNQPMDESVRDPEVARYLASPLPPFQRDTTKCEPPTKNTEGITVFISPSVGWLLCAQSFISSPIGEFRRLYRTRDGGAQWELMNESPMRNQVERDGLMPSVGSLGQLFFLDDLHGWLSVNSWNRFGPPFANSSPLYATDDGGRTWRSLIVTNGYHTITGITFDSPMEGYLAMRDPFRNGEVVLGTHDGGATWAQRYSDAAPDRLWHFFDARRGVGIGSVLDPGAVFMTDDGGATWQQVGSVDGGRSQVVWAMSFPDPLHGWVFAGGLLRTVDGGKTWTALPLRDGAYGLFFADAQTGYIFGYGVPMMVTHDGGESFEHIPPVGPAPPFSIAPIRALEGKPALAVQLFISNPRDQRSGERGGRLAGTLSAVEAITFDDPDAEAQCARLERAGGDEQCRILLYVAVDGGAWTRYDFGAMVPSRIEFDGGVMRWMGQRAGTFYRTDDGGQTWTQTR